MRRTMNAMLLCILIFSGLAGYNASANIGESNIFVIDRYAIILGNNDSLFYLEPNNELNEYHPGSEDRVEKIAHMNSRTNYPFLMEGDIYSFNIENECIAPLGDDTCVISVPITRELARGGEEWRIASIKADNDAIYFLLTDEEQEVPILCRYLFETKEFDTVKIEWLSEYLLNGSGDAIAIAYTGVETILYSVDWLQKPVELYRLRGHYAGFAADQNNLFAADIDELSFVSLSDGKVKERVRSPYAAGVVSGHCMNGHYYALGSEGLYRPDFTLRQEEAHVLRILEGYADDIDRSFMLAHPDVKIEYVPYSSYEGMDFSQALITGVISYDIAMISNDTPAAERLFDKGYAMDLSQSSILLEKAQRMYKPIQQFIFRDEKLMMMPFYTDVRGTAQYNAENMTKMGMTNKDLPKTIEEYMNLIISWREEHGEPESSEDIVPVVGDPNTYRMGLLTDVMVAYQAYYRRIGQELNFNTPEFRRLLEKVDAALEAMPLQTDMYGYLSMIELGWGRVPKVNAIALPLCMNESPRYTGYLQGYMIDPRSTVKELAIDYIVWRMEALSELDSLMLYEGKYRAIENNDYPSYTARLYGEKQALEQAIIREESAAEKRVLQEQIDILSNKIDDPSDIVRYEITEAEIQFYQGEIIPNIEYVYADLLTEYSHANIGTWQMMKRYLDGEMEANRFIEELNQRQRLRRLENE